MRGNARESPYFTCLHQVSLVVCAEVCVAQSGFVFNLTAGSILRRLADMPSRDSLSLTHKRTAYIFNAFFLTATLNNSHDS